MLLRCTLRVLAFWCLGALLTWLTFDLQPKLDSRAEALRYLTVDISGDPPPEVRKRIIRDAEEAQIQYYWKHKDERVLNRVLEAGFGIIFLAMIFGLFAAYSLLIDWNTLRLQYPLPAKS